MDEGDESWVRQAAKGAGISGLNPKVFLLFLALLPQFANPHAPWPVPAHPSRGLNRGTRRGRQTRVGQIP